MKRVLFAALIGCAMLLFSYRQAPAMTEFCPASLRIDAVAQRSSDPAQMYGFVLSAFGPRTVTDATLAFDTSDGWYTAQVPQVTLTGKDRHYSGISTFVRRDWVSPVLYVRFPSAVKIVRAWPFAVRVKDDGAFGWESKGEIPCPPPGTVNTPDRRGGSVLPHLDPNDEDRLTVPPAATSIVLSARASPTLESGTCKDPFSPATTTWQSTPQYPQVLRDMAAFGQTTAIVAVNTDGSVADAWIWAPSGYKAFDDATLTAARNSTYRAGTSYCKTIPGDYLLRVTFEPN